MFKVLLDLRLRSFGLRLSGAEISVPGYQKAPITPKKGCPHFRVTALISSNPEVNRIMRLQHLLKLYQL